MNEKTKEIIILSIVVMIAVFCAVVLVTTGQEPSYVLTCENVDNTSEAFKSCMYLNGKIN